jgi:hypothetical protein
MLKNLGLSIIGLGFAYGLAFGQAHIWSFAEIERMIPYSVVVNSVPGLTYDQYATASVRIVLLLNGDMSPDKVLELSAGEPLIVRASIAIVDALIAENTRRSRVKQTAPSWIADLNAMPGILWIHNGYPRSKFSSRPMAG